MEIDAGRFTVRLARDEIDIAGAQRLRYRVFVEELGASAKDNERALTLACAFCGRSGEDLARGQFFDDRAALCEAPTLGACAGYGELFCGRQRARTVALSSPN